MNRSEGFFHALIEGSYDAVAVLGADATISYASPSFKRVTGYDPRELTGRSAVDFVHPDDVPELLDKLASLVADPGGIRIHSFRFRQKSGDYRLAEATGRNLLEDPEVKGLVVNFRDVTERVAHEKSLRESAELFRIITEQSVAGIMILKDDRVQYANRVLTNITGYAPEELAALPPGGYARLVHPDDRAFALRQARLKQAGRGAQVHHSTARVLARDGSVRWVDLYSRTIYLRGEPADMVILTDVTERERAREMMEKAVRLFLALGADSERNIGLVLHAGREMLDMPYAIYLRMDGRSLRPYRAPNAALWTLFDPLKNELLLKVIARDPDEPLLLQDLSRPPVPPGGEELLGLGLRSLLGQSVAVKDQVVAALVFLGAKPKGFHRREVEVAGMLARALAVEEERASHQRNLKDFVDIVSHEIRHPMTIIRGYAQLLRQYRESIEPELEAEILESIPNAVERMENLVSELLDVSRIDRAQLSILKRDFDPSSILERSVEEMRMRFPQNEFSLNNRGASKAHGDPERLLEVLLILMENAVNYSPPCSKVEVEAVIENDEFLVSVLDRGFGVPIEERTRIFDRFYQVEDVNHHSIPGIGLGLFIAREIVEGHGGRIWCAEREGGGSVFRFAVPI